MPRPTNEPDKKTFAGRLAARIRERRLALELTGEEAAKRASVPVQTWYNWERGRFVPGVDRLPAIARALGWKVREVLPSR